MLQMYAFHKHAMITYIQQLLKGDKFSQLGKNFSFNNAVAATAGILRLHSEAQMHDKSTTVCDGYIVMRGTDH
jgi:hypothetical protein